MPRHHLYALDLDGTCLDESGQSSPQLRRELEKLSEQALVVFATGRNFKSACRAIETAGLPPPHYLVSDVGNQVHGRQGGRWNLDSDYEAFNLSHWTRLEKCCPATDLMPWAVLQETHAVRRRAWWADSEAGAARAAERLEELVSRHSCGQARWDGPTRHKKWWIDLLPGCAGKATAVSFIALLEGIPHSSVAAVGDSLNDFDLLDGRFHAAAPAGASPRLERALRESGTRLRTMRWGGPRGTVGALAWLRRDWERDPKRPEQPGEPAQLPALRGKRSTASLAKGLVVWPDRLRNWGLHLGPWREPTKILTDKVESHLAKGCNWWWEVADSIERGRILERFHAIPVRFLADRLAAYVRCRWPAAKLLGALVSGSYLYGDLPANDLDLVLLLEGLPQGSTVGIEEKFPGLRAAFPRRFAGRLRHDRVGFGILDRKSVNPVNPDPSMLQIAASMAGSGLPLFGQTVCEVPMPAFDLMSQAVKLIGDAAAHLERQGPEAGNKIRLRCAEARCVLALSARSSFAGTEPVGWRQEATGGHLNWTDRLRQHRRKLAQEYLALVTRLLPAHE
jgi:HAD superfamily hydrolase (TIGR01484 family)